MESYAYWLGFLAYSVAVIGIGWRGYRSGKGGSGTFWSTGRQLGTWSAGLSISASFMSVSWSCVYVIQLYYWYGVSALWLVPIPWLLTLAGFYFLAPKFRKRTGFSQPEMVGARFGGRARTLLALPIALVFLVWGGAELFATAQILSPLLDAPLPFVLLLVAAVVAAYSWLGGFAAIISTDKLQFWLISVLVLAIAGLAAAALPENWSEITFPTPPKSGAPAGAFWALPAGLIIVTFIAYLPGWLIETDIWVRLQAAEHDTAARRAVLIAGGNSVVFLAGLPMLIGLAALVLYPPVAGAIPERLNDGAAILAAILQDHSPPALSVLLSVGLAAAAMSTIDTCANILALSLTYDVAEPVLARRYPRIDKQRIARFGAAGAVGLAFFYALFTESLWDIFYLSSGILTTTVFLPVVGVLMPGTKAVQVRAAAGAGFIVTLAAYWLGAAGFLASIEPAWLADTGLGYIVWGFLASLAGFFGLRREAAVAA